MNNKLFISHSSQDDAFVRDLREALADHGRGVWIDSRELRGGDPLWTEIKKAIAEASAYAVVVSPNALQSKWVGKELRHALKVQKKRGKDNFPLIPLLVNGTKLGVLEELELQQSLGDLKQNVQMSSREPVGGQMLWPDIQKTVAGASFYALVDFTDAWEAKRGSTKLLRDAGHSSTLEKAH